MKLFATLVVAAALFAVPMGASAAKHKAPVCAVKPVVCQPTCQQACCFNPLSPVVGVVYGVGGLIQGVVGGIAGIFTCGPAPACPPPPCY